MKKEISKKLSWIICGLGWLTAIISIFFLPDTIPTHFSGGVPGNFSNKVSIFLRQRSEYLLKKEHHKFLRTDEFMMLLV